MSSGPENLTWSLHQDTPMHTPEGEEREKPTTISSSGLMHTQEHTQPLRFWVIPFHPTATNPQTFPPIRNVYFTPRESIGYNVPVNFLKADFSVEVLE